MLLSLFKTFTFIMSKNLFASLWWTFWAGFHGFHYLNYCILSGENLVSEPEGEGEEVDQEEDGSVWWEQRLRAQWSGVSQSPAGPGVPESHRHARIYVPPSGNEHLAIYQEYTAGDCDPVGQLEHLLWYNWALQRAAGGWDSRAASGHTFDLQQRNAGGSSI